MVGPNIVNAERCFSEGQIEPSTRNNDESHVNQLGPSDVHRSYGTLPSRKLKDPPLASGIRRTLAQWGLQRRVRSNSSPLLRSSPTSIRHPNFLSRPISTYDDPLLRSPTSIQGPNFLSRPISTYDDPLHAQDDSEVDADARVNGIRVWYSSFTSIDWLHDAIKDSLRFSRLRRRKSLRGRLCLAFDKSLGWIIVTIVGCLTALVAFLIVRTEQLLFDTKEGYCESSWWKAKRFCCPNFNDEELRGVRLSKEMCPAWRTWADVLSRDQQVYQDGALQYVSYTCIAVSVICLSIAVDKLML